MAKEIEEQPVTLKTGIKEYLDNFNNFHNLSYLNFCMWDCLLGCWHEYI